MSRNWPEAIWQAQRFSDNSQQTQVSERLFKIQPVYKNFLQKFRSVCNPEKELSLHETMIPRSGDLKLDHSIQVK
jgi:hypothetical protein